MQLTIRNYRGIESAQIEIDKLTLVGGQNYAGKTSIAQAAGAVLTGNAMPLPDLKKNQARLFLRDGQKTGSVELEDGEKKAKVTYPGASYSGNADTITLESAGLSSLIDQKPQERLRAMTEILKAEPTKEHLIEAMKAKGFADDFNFQRVWDVIDQYGWDQAYERAKTTGAKLKGGWETITGEHYGSTKAAQWTPEGLTDGTAEDLQKAVDDATAAHEQAIASQAVAASDQDAKAQATAAMEHLRKELVDLEPRYTVAQQEIVDTKSKLQDLPKKPGDSLQTCPWCKNVITFDRDGFVTKGKMLTRETQKAVDEKRADLTAKLDKLSQEVTELGAMLSRTKQSIAINEDILKRPDAAEKKADTSATQAALDTARFAFSAFTAKQEADAKHSMVVQNGDIQLLLKPDGLRKTVMVEALGKLNAKLEEISKAAAWRPVFVDQDMAISYGGRTYPLCSASEQYFCRVALQLAVATVLGHSVVVLDGMDIVLNRPQRNGIFKAILGCGVRALVCMSFASKEEMPDVGKVPGGRGYWVSGGKVE